MSNERQTISPVWPLLVQLCFLAALAPHGIAPVDGAEPPGAEPRRLAAAEFAKADTDGNGRLSLEEFLATRPEPQRADGKPRFMVFDFDGNGTLDAEEFSKLSAPTDQRGTIPDPIVDIEQAALAKWSEIFSAADTNSDGTLSRAEWPAEQLASEIPAVAEATFEHWDRNHDGKVDEPEAKWLLEVAYGLILLDGRPIRTPSGRVFTWSFYRGLDASNDGTLSHDEFVERVYLGKEKNAELFRSLDGNGDGSLTIEETLNFLWHDTVGWFLGFDIDRDGYLTTEEFLKIGWGTSLATRTVRAFDANGDQKISFGEFRGTTFPNQASDWMQLRRDADNDGRLSWQEFYIEKPPFVMAQSRWFFDHFDLDHDGFLSLDELEFSVDPGKAPPEIALRLVDSDRDGFVSRDEFLANVPEPERVDRARRFLVFDFDGDGKLAASEYRQTMASTDDRGAIPDPFIALEQTALKKWETLFAAADEDGDGALGRQEWPAKQLAREIPAVAEATFDRWDRNHDGKVDEPEAEWLLEVAYGLTLLDGRAIRAPSGRVFSWYFYRALDVNHDGTLSRDEFIERMFLGKEKNAALFGSLDANRDGHLTVEETWTFLWHDTLGQFLAWDSNLDGYLTTDEFLKVGYGKHLALRTVRAFDDDEDSRISYPEFRSTTFANEGSDWLALRQDADGDGRLSFAEFYREEPPLLVAQAHWFFDHLDQNQDGFLSLGELEFNAAADKVPPEELLAARDLNGDDKLELSEVFTEAKPSGDDAAALQPYQVRLAAAENRFLNDDQDSDGYLDVKELTEAQRSVVEAAQRQAKVLSDRKTMLEGNYLVRRGILVVNELAFLAIVWMVVRKTNPKQGSQTRQGSRT